MIKETGGEAHFVETDVTKATEVEALVAAFITNYGGLDYAVNNAGIGGTAFTPAAEYKEEIWDVLPFIFFIQMIFRSGQSPVARLSLLF